MVSAVLIRTRRSAAVAVALITFLLVGGINEISARGNAPSRWLIEPGLLHGRVLVALNLALYAWVLWIVYWFIRGTHGRERIVMSGGFTSLIFWPLKIVQHGWILEVRYIGLVGYVVGLIAAVSLLLHPSST